MQRRLHRRDHRGLMPELVSPAGIEGLDDGDIVNSVNARRRPSSRDGDDDERRGRRARAARARGRRHRRRAPTRPATRAFGDIVAGVSPKVSAILSGAHPRTYDSPTRPGPAARTAPGDPDRSLRREPRTPAAHASTRDGSSPASTPRSSAWSTAPCRRPTPTVAAIVAAAVAVPTSRAASSSARSRATCAARVQSDGSREPRWRVHARQLRRRGAARAPPQDATAADRLHEPWRPPRRPGLRVQRRRRPRRHRHLQGGRARPAVRQHPGRRTT